MKTTLGLLILCAAFAPGHAAATAPGDEVPATATGRRMPQPLTISAVAARPKQVDFATGQQVTVSFALNRPADIVVRFYNQQQALVRTFSLGQRAAGESTVSWDGRGEDGKPCSGQWFIYTIVARDERGDRVVYDPADATAGQELTIRKFVFDPAKGLLSYVLPRTGMVRIRIGLKDGPLLRTLVDWSPQLAGTHEQSWDGSAASGLMNLLKEPRLHINLSTYSLPGNCIITKAGQESIPRRPGPKAERRPLRRAGRTAGWYYHWAHDPARCHEPQFTVTFPEADREAVSDRPVLSGRPPVRVQAAPGDKADLVNHRFEVMFYVDGVYLHEDENGSNPLTYYWDTSGLAPGVHTLTVNVMSYHDHVGTVTRTVVIGGAK